MTTVKSRVVHMLLILLSSSVLLINGCGRDAAQDEGCPSDSYTANDTDSLTGPTDGSFIVTSVYGNAFAGGIYYFAPLVYTVHDSTGLPKNKICVTFYTGGSYSNGIWYADSNYSSVVTGAGAMNLVLAVTDDNGRIMMYWSTGVLPPANPVTLSGTTYTAGADQDGSTWIQAYSGNVSTLFTESWTVKGEPGP